MPVKKRFNLYETLSLVIYEEMFYDRKYPPILMAFCTNLQKSSCKKTKTKPIEYEKTKIRLKFYRSSLVVKLVNIIMNHNIISKYYYRTTKGRIKEILIVGYLVMVIGDNR